MNNFFATIYRWIAIKFLIGIFIIAFCFAFLTGFFTLSTSWAVPLVLSPSQEHVLSFQPQIAALQANLNKQRIELATATATVQALDLQLVQVHSLLGRISIAMSTEAKQLDATGKVLSTMLAEKQQDIKATQQATAEARGLLKSIDDELEARLITSDQAAQRRIALQGALNSSTDAKTSAIQLEQLAQQMRQGSSTFRGGSTSLVAITTIKHEVELRSLEAQLKIQYATASATIRALQDSITENERVLEVAKTSPYYLALTESVNVAFVPYENFDNVEVGKPIYDCYLKILICRKVGEVARVYDAEEYARHPLFKTDLKGKLVELKFDNTDAAEAQVIFVGGKPLLL